MTTGWVKLQVLGAVMKLYHLHAASEYLHIKCRSISSV